MPRYEYKVVPAPAKGLKGKGVKGAEARFSYGLQELMNGLAGYGWEYQRAETLPSVERVGLTGTSTEWRNVLIFRRLRKTDAEAFEPELLPSPAAMPPLVSEAPDPVIETGPLAAEPGAPEQDADKKVEAPSDNGVEDTANLNGVGPALSSLAATRDAEKLKD